MAFVERARQLFRGLRSQGVERGNVTVARLGSEVSWVRGEVNLQRSASEGVRPQGGERGNVTVARLGSEVSWVRGEVRGGRLGSEVTEERLPDYNEALGSPVFER